MSLPTLHPKYGMRWSVKDSFRRYVLGVGGTISTAAPALNEGDQTYFPLDQVRTDERGLRVYQFSGDVAFRAHANMLSLTISNPWVHLDEEKIVLSIEGRNLQERILFGKLASSAGSQLERMTTSSARSFLTEQGISSFDFTYPAGTELAPVSFVLPEISS